MSSATDKDDKTASVSDPKSPDYDPHSPYYEQTMDSSSKYYVGPITDNTSSGDDLRNVSTLQVDLMGTWLGPALSPEVKNQLIQDIYEKNLEDSKKGLADGLKMRDPGTPPTTDWGNATHEQMQQAITTSADPATVAESSEEWVSVGNDLTGHQKSLGDAISASTSDWQGGGGDAAREHLANVGKWLGETAQGSVLSGRQQEIHSQALNQTQIAMKANPPVEFNVAQSMAQLQQVKDPVAYGATAGLIVNKYREQQAAREQAAQTMTQYDKTIAGAVSTPHFPAPPKLASGSASPASVSPRLQGSPRLGPDGKPVGPNGGPLGPDGKPILGPNGIPVGPNGQPMGPDGKPLLGPNGQPLGPNGQPLGPNGQPLGPNGQPLGPNGQPLGPNGLPLGPNGQPLGPNGQPLGPNGLPLGPNGQPLGPDGKPLGPGGVPQLNLPNPGDSTHAQGYNPPKIPDLNLPPGGGPGPGSPGGSIPGGGNPPSFNPPSLNMPPLNLPKDDKGKEGTQIQGYNPPSIPDVNLPPGGGPNGINPGGIPKIPDVNLPPGGGPSFTPPSIPGGISLGGPGGGSGSGGGKIPSIGLGGGVNGESISSRLGGGGAGGIGGLGGGKGGSLGGPGSATGAGSLTPEELAARGGAAGAGGKGAAGSPGMGGMGAGGKGGKGPEDKEHKIADFVESDDPLFFSPDEVVAPPVIGDWKNTDWK
ncbi:PPE domain-containing protein [Amycolatopsis sp. NBC_01480]|uniref:PPE domain-containing protein n=1 Tax=Amycolatopsis sp. NBC_01480 TaxID=2903562 RepID=UPI002E2876B3|nr:PPE domain-containing protein [Amycolatopsis sp. NBC_01480]